MFSISIAPPPLPTGGTGGALWLLYNERVEGATSPTRRGGGDSTLVTKKTVLLKT